MVLNNSRSKNENGKITGHYERKNVSNYSDYEDLTSEANTIYQ